MPGTQNILTMSGSSLVEAPPTLNYLDAAIHTQEIPPHKRFLVGCSSPATCESPDISRRFAVGARNVLLVGENPTSSVPAL